MSAGGISAEVALSSDIGTVKWNPMYRYFVESHHGLDFMRRYNFEANILRYYCEHVFNLPDESSHMLAAIVITDALDKAFVITTD